MIFTFFIGHFVLPLLFVWQMTKNDDNGVNEVKHDF